MTSLTLPEQDLVPVSLGLTSRPTLGAGGGEEQPPAEMFDRISLGRPACLPLDPSAVDAQTRVFLDGKPESHFWLLALSCSFRAVDKEPMESAWVEITLRTVRPDGAEEPAAWSMEPIAQSDAVEVSKVVKLNAELKLTSELVPVEIGPSVGREQTQTYTSRRPYVEAYREGTARPSWIFSRTPATEIRGLHRLRTVVELPVGAIGQAEVSAGAKLRLKYFGLIPYRANLADLPERRILQIRAAER